jgi:hypothetical protein
MRCHALYLSLHICAATPMSWMAFTLVRSHHMASAYGQNQQDLTADTLRERLMQQLRDEQRKGILGDCPDDRIAATVSEVVGRLFPQARVTTFLPVIAHRQVKDRLRGAGVAAA